MSIKIKVLIGVLVSIIVLAIVGFVALVLWVTPPEGIIVTIDLPEQVSVDEVYPIEVTVQNVSLEEREVTIIEMQDSFLEGIDIISSDPIFADKLGGFGFDTHYFEELYIQPESEAVIIFEARADREGYFIGDINVCIDTEGSCVTNQIRTKVNE